MKAYILILSMAVLFGTAGVLPAQDPIPIPDLDLDPDRTEQPDDNAPKVICKGWLSPDVYLGPDCELELSLDDIVESAYNYDKLYVSQLHFTCDDIGYRTIKAWAEATGTSDTIVDSCAVRLYFYGDIDPTCPDNTTIALNDSGVASISPEQLSGYKPSGRYSDGTYSVLSQRKFDCMDIGPNPVVVTIVNRSGVLSSCTAVVTVTGNAAASCTAQRWYVDAANGQDSNDGLSWSNAFASLQPAIESAQSGDHIWVAGGTYQPTAYPRNATAADGSALPDNPRYYTFHLPDGVEIYGGFSGDENYLSERRMGRHPSVLDGNLGTGPVFHVVSAVKAGTESVLDGFVISGGRAAYLGNAIVVDGAPLSSANGGGIACSQSEAAIRNVAVVNNYARAGGGGISISNASPQLTNVTVAGNSSDQQGGGIYVTASAFPTLTNATVAGNTAKNSGSGLYIYNLSSEVTLNNSVFFQNDSGQDILTESGAQVTGADTYTQQNPSGYGNPTGFYRITQNPFMDRGDPDGPDDQYGTRDDGLRPIGSGQLRNAGNATLNSDAVDLLGNDRVSDGQIDVGAYENQ